VHLRLLLILPALGLLVYAALVAAREPDPLGTAVPPAQAPVRLPETPLQAVVPREPPDPPPIRWRRSIPLGQPGAGRLVRGVRLPAWGPLFHTWDPVLKRSPNRPWRRWGTDRLLRVILRVARSYRAAHPAALPMLVGDLSRPHGGDFGPQFGYIGHATHQNGLDVDVYYPRSDRLPRAPLHAGHIDRRLSQDLVDRFLRAGAEVIYVGPATGLTGPPGKVVAIANHDNHLHVRIP
jgi:murein endopeptidase